MIEKKIVGTQVLIKLNIKKIWFSNFTVFISSSISY